MWLDDEKFSVSEHFRKSGKICSGFSRDLECGIKI